MSSSDVAISVRGLSKAYTIRHNDPAHITLAEQALARIRYPFRRMERETFWALDDVSFDVPRGEVLGIIGRNGAGKSTLLKILSRITAPTKGEVRLYGRVGSLLEVGTGFHPELTGRENVYLNGSILGMRKSEIDRQFDAIVDFAGVERFLDTPVKRYSSGMYVRLAFAVAAHLETEILLVDEVLAVGDAEFQKKCFGKMDEVAHAGRTVLLVTHNLASVRHVARHGLVIERGVVTSEGNIAEVLDAYALSRAYRSHHHVDLRETPRTDVSLPQQVLLESARVVGDLGGGVVSWASRARVRVRIAGRAAVGQISISVTVRNADGEPMGVTHGADFEPPSIGDCLEVDLLLPPLRFLPGAYRLDLAIGQGSVRGHRLGLDKVSEAVGLELASVDAAGRSISRWWSGFGPIDLGELDVAVAQAESVARERAS
jgi:ABC-type polysaccharide/polyol phosphate transport system ATPase subunit